jgi:NAD(P)-dependent dehydrogenase (short-subunit alcohol dehydrogenase family)
LRRRDKEDATVRPRLKPIEDQTIVITGASSGIGLATARLAAARGARVVLAARSGEALERVASAIRTEGGAAATVVADVADERDVRRIAEAAHERFGGLDTWVNNAGVSVYGAITEVPLEDQRQVFETNYWGVVHGCRVAVEHLRDRGGALINVGSVLSERAFPLQGAYSASKHAIKGFTDALRMELMHEGAPISVTLIKPAAIDTRYAHHARNYLPMQPKNPPPLYAPEVVARAILHAAVQPVREITVGGSGRLIEALDHWLPGATDRVMARLLPAMQQSRAPAVERGGAGLYAAAGEARERSGDASFVLEHSAYSATARHPLGALGLAVVAAGAIAFATGLLRHRAGR